MQVKGIHWRWIWGDDGTLYDVGLNADGTLHNPNGYPEERVRAAVAEAQERLHQRRSEAARKAAETRRQRQEQRVYDVVRMLKAGGTLTPGTSCRICGKALGDPDSLARAASARTAGKTCSSTWRRRGGHDMNSPADGYQVLHGKYCDSPSCDQPECQAYWTGYRDALDHAAECVEVALKSMRASVTES